MVAMRRMFALSLPAVALFATLAGAAGSAGLEVPAKSPLAKRTRGQAVELATKSRQVHERVRKGEKPTPDQLRQAVADLEQAVNLFEKAQKMEWNLDANRAEMEALRAWSDLRKITPAAEPPTDPKEKARFESKQRSAAKERLRDARRFVSKLLQGRKHAKVFGRCGRCDGRGELRSAFGDKSVCNVCRGTKHMTDRKSLLRAYWFAHSPFFRGDARNRSMLNYVLRTGISAEERLANAVSPYILSSNVSGKIEDHEWWFRVTAKEKVVNKGSEKKGIEQTSTYIVMNVGHAWWVYAGRIDRELLVPPEDES